MWRAAGLSIALAGSDIGFPRVSTSFDFHAPLHFEDEFEVWIRIEAISPRTIRYACTITRGETKIATGTMTAVCVQKTSAPMRATEIPKEIAERFQRFSR